jgi:hypothetical protein
MTHTDILTAARERLAAIDAQIVDLTAERAKLAAMVDVSDGKTGSETIEETLRRIGTPLPPAVPNTRPLAPPFPHERWIPIIGPSAFVAYHTGPTLTFG